MFLNHWQLVTKGVDGCFRKKKHNISEVAFITSPLPLIIHHLFELSYSTVRNGHQHTCSVLSLTGYCPHNRHWFRFDSGLCCCVFVTCPDPRCNHDTQRPCLPHRCPIRAPHQPKLNAYGFGAWLGGITRGLQQLHTYNTKAPTHRIALDSQFGDSGHPFPQKALKSLAHP